MRKKQDGLLSLGVLKDLVQWSFIDPRSWFAMLIYTRRFPAQRVKALLFGVRMSVMSTQEKVRVLLGGQAFRG